jgi:anthranilate phosphoribosyltransferase
VFQFLSKEIEGGKNKDLADMFINIISGKGTEAQNNVVCANAGMAINNKL